MSEVKQVVRHWLLRVGDGKHLHTSSQFGIWGVSTHNNTNVKNFIGFGKKASSSAKPGDILWFIKSGSGGLAIACAIFTEFVLREPGKTMSDSDLGWDVSPGSSNGNWDYEVRFTHFTDVSHLKILTEIKSACSVRLYNERCKADLPSIYENFNIVENFEDVNESDSKKLENIREVCHNIGENLQNLLDILNKK